MVSPVLSWNNLACFLENINSAIFFYVFHWFNINCLSISLIPVSDLVRCPVLDALSKPLCRGLWFWWVGLLIWGFQCLIWSKSLGKSLSRDFPVSLLSWSIRKREKALDLGFNKCNLLIQNLALFSCTSLFTGKTCLVIITPPNTPHCWQIHTTMWDTKAWI